ncbi:f-box domain-containing protein [Trichonephila clavipes]|nr:f-box domain-containing protein [Trichonephila clavipes]
MKSPNLKILDVRGCLFLTAVALCNLPASNLERLYVFNTELYNHFNFIDVLRKWGHSLEVLDLCRLRGNRINDHFTSIISSCNLRNLESLDISHTAVTISTVQLIIENCPKLNFLQLVACQELHRGCKRAHRGKIALKELLSKLADNMDTSVRELYDCFD